jgi:hypothetical protein
MGIMKVNVLPFSISLWTVIFPSCMFTNLLTSANPKPVPLHPLDEEESTCWNDTWI